MRYCSPRAVLFKQIEYCTEYFIQIILGRSCYFSCFFQLRLYQLELFPAYITWIFSSHFLHTFTFYSIYNIFFGICKNLEQTLTRSKITPIKIGMYSGRNKLVIITNKTDKKIIPNASIICFLDIFQISIKSKKPLQKNAYSAMNNIQLSHVNTYSYYITLSFKCQQFSPKSAIFFVIYKQLRKMKKSCATCNLFG